MQSTTQALPTLGGHALFSSYGLHMLVSGWPAAEVATTHPVGWKGLRSGQIGTKTVIWAALDGGLGQRAFGT